MTREEQIKAIYEKIADKTLSRWCLIEFNMFKWWQFFRIVDVVDDCETYEILELKYMMSWFLDNISMDFLNDETIRWFTIKWHPVMIWDVLDYYRGESWVNVGVLTILEKWNYKRKPIEEQSDECIEFIYNLIKYANT